MSGSTTTMEDLDRRQRQAIQQAAAARAAGRMDEFHVAIRTIDGIAMERQRLRRQVTARPATGRFAFAS